MRKKITFIPTAWSGKAFTDFGILPKLYKENFDVYIISDKYSEDKIYFDGIYYVRNHTSYADYLVYTSDCIFDCGTMNRKSRVSEKQKRISLWHGFPYKKMFVTYDKKYLLDTLNYQKSYDLMVSPSKNYSEKFLRDSMLYNGNILEVGSPRADILFKTDPEVVKKNIGCEGKKIILYAPTYREKGKFKLPFDHNKILEKFTEEYVFAIKAHYLCEVEQEDGVLDLTDYSNINELLVAADILITDYSSLMFDYSILNKPIVFFQYDYDSYSSDRGFNFYLTDYVFEKYIPKTLKELYNVFDEKLGSNAVKLKELSYPLENGNSSQKVYDSLNLKPHEFKSNEIIFLVNDLHQIGGIHQFILNLTKMLKEKSNRKVSVIAINEYPDNFPNGYVFDKENLVDLKISKSHFSGACKTILENTNATIIALQFSAYMSFQELLSTKNAILMFHGDGKDFANKRIYKWHIDHINNRKIYNYKKLCFISKNNYLEAKKNLMNNCIPFATYINNSIDTTNAVDLSDQTIHDYVWVGRLDFDKNVTELIRLFKSKRLKENVRVFVYGDGPLYYEMESQIEKNNLKDKIILKGFETQKEVIFKDKRALLVTSVSEGMGLVILEAFKFGVPVICYNSFVTAKDLVDSKTGYLIEHNDVDGYVNALNDDHIFKYINLSEKLYHFSNEKIVLEWEKLIDEVKFNSPINSEKSENDVVPQNLNFTEEIENEQSVEIIDNFMQKKEKATILNYETIFKEGLKISFLNLSIVEKAPLVSIIIPYYNSAATIIETIDSINKLTYDNVEIILVNDGSEEPLPKFTTNRKCKIIDKNNEGLGITRNKGIKAARGKYVFFLDADDTLPPNSIGKMVEFAESNDVEIVAGKCKRVNLVDDRKTHFWFENIYKNNYVNTMDKRHLLLQDTISTNKLYKKKIFEKYNLYFEEGLYEDKLFMHHIYNSVDSIGIITEHVYNWKIYGANTSITSTLTVNNFTERLNRVKFIIDDAPKSFKTFYMNFAISHDFKIYMLEFHNFKYEEQQFIFNKLTEFFEKNFAYANMTYIPVMYNIEYVDCILNNDLERLIKFTNLENK